MSDWALCLFLQLYLTFGMFGLFWPDKLMPLFGVLMFPWSASHRMIRANGVGAIAAYLLLLVKLRIAGF